MEMICYLCPGDEVEYQRLLNEIGPWLDDAGISFHICRPGEQLPGTIPTREVRL